MFTDDPQEISPGSSAEGPSGGRDARPARVVRFGAMGRVGEFSHKPNAMFACHQKVVVQTDRGIELGELVGSCAHGGGCNRAVPRPQLQEYVRNSGQEFCQPRAGRILRGATDQDLNEHRHLNANVTEDVRYCAEAAHRLGLDMKIITAEHLLGGERIVFYFGSPTRVDFRQLVKELAQRYRTRIEMRQVGARDEARLVADYEVCGRECCCKNFLKKLRPVNMKMAKLQKSTLDPSKVSGRCGRLRCCLRYEHDGYEELAERLPRVGSRVRTEFGPATVIDRQILTQLLLVRTDEGQEVAVPLEEITEFNLPPAPPPPPRDGPRDAGRETRGATAPVSAAPPPRPAGGLPLPLAPVAPPPSESRGEPPGERARRRRRGRRGSRPGGEGAPPPREADRGPLPSSAAPAETSERGEAGPDSGVPGAGAPDGDNLERKRRRRGRRRRRPGPGGPAPESGSPPAGPES